MGGGNGLARPIALLDALQHRPLRPASAGELGVAPAATETDCARSNATAPQSRRRGAEFPGGFAAVYPCYCQSPAAAGEAAA